MLNMALDGVFVIDLSRVVAGPYASMLLADMGAEVIKIESPATGDDSRQFGPLVQGESPYFMTLNRNKKSMTLNLKSEQGKEILWRLCEKADILIENFRPGVMDKLGFGYDTLHKKYPRLVYGCISGFGQYGPYKDRPGYDILGQAMGGMMSVTGWPNGLPTKVNTSLGDFLGGLSLATGVLAAYIKSLKTGIGEKVDVSLTDSVVSCLATTNHIYLATGEVPKLMGNRDAVISPYGSYLCKDGSIVIACANNKLFSQLADLMGKPELAKDSRFETNVKRMEHNDQLQKEIEEFLSDKTMEEAVQILLDAKIPAGPINTLDKVVNDAHIAGARNMFPEIQHCIAGKLKITGNQIKMSETDTSVRLSPPLLGQQTEEILCRLGYCEKEIQQFRSQKVI